MTHRMGAIIRLMFFPSKHLTGRHKSVRIYGEVMVGSIAVYAEPNARPKAADSVSSPTVAENRLFVRGSIFSVVNS